MAVINKELLPIRTLECMDDSLENQLIGSLSITNQVFLSDLRGKVQREKGRRER